ncbi:DUF6924 domain-containing protein [Streptomyces sp. NPDC020801]|uniref:DUF6924 domain-containing protein n=1 Tax=unclassified Streptomyces TaxID=2593676 RepID=UPI00379C9033
MALPQPGDDRGGHRRGGRRAGPPGVPRGRDHHGRPERRLLAVDLHDEPGRTFRLPPRWFPGISANLSIANMDFAESADATDGSGTYRGIGAG